jgi:hypothetical protein
MGESSQSSGGGTKRPTRDELNAKAAELGVDNPESLQNMEEVEAAIQAAEDEPRFSREEVLAHARSLTGHSRNLMAGALHGNDQRHFTKAEAKSLGDKFAKHEQEKPEVE